MRLRDVPATIGWDGLALFVRHLPRDSELARELDPMTCWSTETHALVTISDQINLLMYGLGGARGAQPTPAKRPGAADRYEGAELVDISGRLADVTWKEERDGW